MADERTSGTGRCLCGAVRYWYEGEPIAIGLCQCERCQRQSGSAFLIGVVFPKDKVRIQGRLTICRFDISGRLLERHFCPTCGSAVSIMLERYPDLCSLMGGTLDDKAKIKPKFSVWCSSGQNWLSLPADIICYPEYPEGTFGG